MVVSMVDAISCSQKASSKSKPIRSTSAHPCIAPQVIIVATRGSAARIRPLSMASVKDAAGKVKASVADARSSARAVSVASPMRGYCRAYIDHALDRIVVLHLVEAGD